MSRIEDAIERAAKIRGSGDNGGTAEAVTGDIGDAFSTVDAIRPACPYLATLNEPESPIAEEYRKLKSLVVKLTKNGTLQNTLMVTSTSGDEGKSITALNLAISLAQEYDHTVLLIDADL